MTRPPRTDFPEAWHHVTNRTVRQEPIFRKDQECIMFLDALGEAVERMGLEVHAYALMPSHFHAVVRSPLGNVSRAIGHSLSVYTIRSNRVSQWDGPLLRGRFRSQVITSDEYLRYVVAYVHLNPVLAQLVERPDEACWTSFRGYMGVEPPKSWLSCSKVLELHGGCEEMASFTAAVQGGALAWPEMLDLEKGWIRGARGGPKRDGAEVRHRGALLASPETVLVDVLEVTGADDDELDRSMRGRGGNPVRRFAVWALDRETTLTHGEIGSLLEMSAANVRMTLLQIRRIGGPTVQEREWMEAWVGGRRQVVVRK